eukprot:288080-Hanusia_phi.AAC.1
MKHSPLPAPDTPMYRKVTGNSKYMWVMRHAEKLSDVDEAWSEKAERSYDSPITESGRDEERLRTIAGVNSRLRPRLSSADTRTSCALPRSHPPPDHERLTVLLIAEAHCEPEAGDRVRLVRGEDKPVVAVTLQLSHLGAYGEERAQETNVPEEGRDCW